MNGWRQYDLEQDVPGSAPGSPLAVFGSIADVPGVASVWFRDDGPMDLVFRVLASAEVTVPQIRDAIGKLPFRCFCAIDLTDDPAQAAVWALEALE